MADTPPTGTAIPPRPKRFETVAQPSEVRASSGTHVPEDAGFRVPANPTLRDLYSLIDQRLTPEIIERISSIPPPESRPSLAVHAARTAGRWTKWAMAALGVLAVVGELYADVEKYRGPISQAVVIIARVLDAQEAAEATTPPPPAP